MSSLARIPVDDLVHEADIHANRTRRPAAGIGRLLIDHQQGFGPAVGQGSAFPPCADPEILNLGELRLHLGEAGRVDL